MASFKNNPTFYTSLLLIGAVTAGQAWLIFSQRAETKRLLGEVEQKQQVLQRFAYSSPFPSRDNAAAVEADRIQAEETLARIRKALQSSSELVDKIATAKVPSTSTDAFFDLASFVERMRENATKAEVVVSPTSWFGFSTYSSTGPSRDLIGPVFRQRQYVEYLLEALMSAKPREIRSVERNRPLTPEQKLAMQAAIDQGVAPTFAPEGGTLDSASDYFVIDPRTSAHNEGSVDTEPFRLTFSGTTEVLRAFLNELAQFKLPVVVRSVEVEPLDKTQLSPAPGAYAPAPAASPFGGVFDAASDAAPIAEVKPLVEQIDSLFVVTVEFIKLVDKSEAASNTP